MSSSESTADQAANETAWQPIAIVGMACRFPGGPDLETFWRLLDSGQTAVTEGTPGSGVGRVGQLFPDGPVEWPACRYGAFVDDIDQFDAEFFRISPLEAQLLDPQQRMMLETCWRALEDAGIDPESLRGSRTGVYAGMSNKDYRHLMLASRENAEATECRKGMWGSDFPHDDSTWPHSREAVARNFAGMPVEYMERVTHGNVTALYGLDS